MVDELTASVLITFSFINILMHTIGCLLLINNCKQRRKTRVQTLYLIWISTTTIVKNILAIMLVILELPGLDHQWAVEFREYLGILFGSVVFVYYWFMFTLTSDRLAATILNFKYRRYWNLKRAKYLIASTIFINISVCIGMFILYSTLGQKKFKQYYVSAIFYTYIPSILDLSFLILAIITYSIIFLRYIQSMRQPWRTLKRTSSSQSSRQSLNNKNKDRCSLFFESRFLISLFIILSFVCFSVIPGLVFACFEIVGKQIPEKLLLFVYISFKLSDAVESVIYSFMQRSIKNELWRRMTMASLLIRRATV